jgi:hypothetical protein
VTEALGVRRSLSAPTPPAAPELAWRVRRPVPDAFGGVQLFSSASNYQPARTFSWRRYL